MKMLDLYCGEGLAAIGYMSSGVFKSCVGVDIVDMSTRYLYAFEMRNALSMNYEELSGFDFIHASPPCQAYSKMTRDKSKHQRLIAATHLMLYASGKPYVIENVEGSGVELRPNLVMDGTYFGLQSVRRRYFYVSTLEKPMRLLGKKRSGLSPQGDTLTRALLIEAMGLGNLGKEVLGMMTKHGIEQGIPPVFTNHIVKLMSLGGDNARYE